MQRAPGLYLGGGGVKRPGLGVNHPHPSIKIKGKGFPLQAWNSSWGSRRSRLRIVSTFGTMKVVRSLPLRTGRLYPQMFSWYSFLEAEWTPGHKVPLVTSEKIPSDITGDRHPSSAEVKERVELYVYPTSGPLWPALGQNYIYISCIIRCRCHFKLLCNNFIKFFSITYKIL
jgi:hypothetical protein